MIVDELTQGEIEDIFGDGRSLLAIIKNTIRLKRIKKRSTNVSRTVQAKYDATLQE